MPKGYNEQAKKNVLLGVVLGTVVTLVVLCCCFLIVFLSVVIPIGANLTSARNLLKNDLKIGLVFSSYKDSAFEGQMMKAAVASTKLHKAQQGGFIENELVVCEKCDKNSETATKNEILSMYKKGIRLFVGPLTSHECSYILPWALKRIPSAIFVSPSATASDLSQYTNFIRLVVGNAGRGMALIATLGDLSSRHNCTIGVHAVIRDDVSANEIMTMIQDAEGPQIEVKSLTKFVPGSVDYESIARTLEGHISGDDTECSRVFLVAHSNEVEELLKSGQNSAPDLLNYEWLGGGFGFSHISEDVVDLARTVSLASVLYEGSNVVETEEREAFAEIVGGMIEDDEEMNSLVFQVHDAILLIHDTARMYRTTDPGVIMESLFAEATHEFGLSGHLSLHPELRNRKNGQYMQGNVVGPNALNFTWMEVNKIVFTDMGDSHNDTRRRALFGHLLASMTDTGYLHIPASFFQERCSQGVYTYWQGVCTSCTWVEYKESSGLVKKKYVNDWLLSGPNGFMTNGLVVPLKGKFYLRMVCKTGPSSGQFYDIKCPPALSGTGTVQCELGYNLGFSRRDGTRRKVESWTSTLLGCATSAVGAIPGIGNAAAAASAAVSCASGIAGELGWV